MLPAPLSNLAASFFVPHPSAKNADNCATRRLSHLYGLMHSIIRDQFLLNFPDEICADLDFGRACFHLWQQCKFKISFFPAKSLKIEDLIWYCCCMCQTQLPTLKNVRSGVSQEDSMKRKRSSTVFCGILVLLVAVVTPSRIHGQDAKSPYPNMAPRDQYLMDRDAEIALARSAAPE